MRIRLLLLFIYAAVSFREAAAQELNWANVENDIAKKINLTQLRQRLEQAKTNAMQRQDYAVAARCYFNQMQIADLKTEDTLYFKNSYFIDSFLKLKGLSLEMESVMLILKAKRISKFNLELGNKKNKNLFTIPPGTTNYTKLNTRQLDSLVQFYFNQAKDISLKLPNEDVKKVLWLSTDPLLFLFKPGFTDIVFAEQLHYTAATGGYFNNINNDFLHLTPDEFIKAKKLPEGLNIKQEKIYSLYQQWADYHNQQKDIFYFIESLARKYFYNRISIENSVNKPYESYLLQLTQSPYEIVKANSVYQLCLYWYNLGNNYTQRFSIYLNNYSSINFDTTYRDYYLKSMRLFKDNTSLLDSFSYLKKDLLVMNQEIENRKLTVKNQDTWLPGEPVKCHLAFKNVRKIYIKVVKLSSLDFVINAQPMNKNKLVEAKSFKDTTITLPTIEDFQTHAAEIELASLPLGYYAILYSDSAITNENKKVDFFRINVSNISAINNDNRLYVLNRKSGQPLSGAKVLVKYRRPVKDSTTNAAIKKVKPEGYVTVSEENVTDVFVMNGSDTTRVQFAKTDASVPDEVFGKDEYDDLLEYYGDNMVVHFFTDKAIYRPGQTVYFKGILFTRNPHTGELILLNKHNLKFPLLKRLFDKEVKELWKEKFLVYIKDAFGRNVDSIKTSINEYGSISGSYKIGPNAATGDWSLDTELTDVAEENDGSFKVEEYKRPTFELTVEKPTEYLQLGDSFYVTVKVRSFADAQLNNVLIKYSVSANYSYPVKDRVTGKESNQWRSDEIEDSSGYTNSNGELQIKIPSRFLQQYQFDNKTSQSIRYDIGVEAVDVTGESHEESLNVNLSNRPVSIIVSMPTMRERQQIGLETVTAKNDFLGNVTKQLKAVIYKLDKTNEPERNYLNNTDYIFKDGAWIYKIQNEKNEKESPEKKKLIYQTEFTSNVEKLKLPQELLDAGDYKLEITCTENGNLIGETSRLFSVFDKEKNKWADEKHDFHYMPVNTAATGEKIKWYFGSANNVYSIYHAQYFATTSKGPKAKYDYDIKNDGKGLHEWEYTMPHNAIDRIYLTHLYVFNNELHRETTTIFIAKKQIDKPELIIEQYRKRLTPGSKETFVVTIKTNNENTAAELMTTMYDASLDKIEKLQWKTPTDHLHYNLDNSWPYNIGGIGATSLFNNYSATYRLAFEKEPLLWWLSPSDSAYMGRGVWNRKYTDENDEMRFSMLSGKVSGISISESNLSDVVVTAYGISKRALTGSATSIIIRGSTSLTDYNIPLVIIDGQIYEGDISKINTGLITDAVVLKGADATGIYGSKAAAGVIVLSTKGPVQLPKPEEPPVIIRKNFYETALFYPQIHADKEGFYNISFTIPESVTEWKWKMLAYTKEAKFMYEERNIVTQLPLMIQPNMPRFLYQGDVINLQARISNLDTNNLSGISTCVIEDAVTGEDITSQVVAAPQANFSVEKKSNTATSYLLKIPENFLHPLTIRINARAGNISDGEEYTIPVLSKKILVSQNVIYQFVAKDTTIESPVIPADAKTYGIGMYLTPKPQSALVNALPSLAFDPYNCAEQTFNKMLAYSLALKIMRTDSNARQTMAHIQALQVSAKNPQALPDELSEQTMPWLQLNHQSQIHQRQLLKLFDTLQAKTFIEKYLEDISSLQNQDGGITWFKGGNSNYYISCYLVEGMGKLKNDSINFLINKNVTGTFNKMTPSLIAFCDTSFVTGKYYRRSNLFFLLARSYWLKEFPLSVSVAKKLDSLLTASLDKIESYGLEDQALLILAGMRYKSKEDPIHQQAIKQLASIRQLAVTDDTNGVRWKDISNKDDLDATDEETIAMLASAYEETDTSKNIVDGIIHWLLTSKQQHNWSTTKSTAAVVDLLSKHEPSVTGNPIVLDASINDSLLSVTDNLLTGQLFNFVQTQKFPPAIYLKKDDHTSTRGGFNYYYFTATPPSENVADVKISKKLFRFNGAGNTWAPIDSATTLKIADKIKTVITIDAKRQLKYVFIDEKDAASLEPADPLSGYEYGKDFNYYRSVRDAGCQFFAEQIPSGISTISYETIVAKEGVFNDGIVSLQCMYQPQVRAYAQGEIIRIEK